MKKVDEEVKMGSSWWTKIVKKRKKTKENNDDHDNYPDQKKLKYRSVFVFIAVSNP